MSWESSALYYRLVNQGVRAALGGHHSAKLLMLSVDFAEIAALQHAGDWVALAERMTAAARTLAGGGAEAIVLCTNTMHKLADAIEAAVDVPLLHIADATGAALRDTGVSRVGLLGTAFTMEEDFYRRRLEDRWGAEVLIPEAEDRALVHCVIYDELVQGVVRDGSHAGYRDVMARLVEAGAEGIVLGCTEIGLLVGDEDASVPLFDTTTLHAEAVVRFALG